MAKDIGAAMDALDRAEGINQGLDALVSLLFCANEADVPSGRKLGELLYSIQQDMEKRLAEAQAGLRNSK